MLSDQGLTCGGSNGAILHTAGTGMPSNDADGSGSGKAVEIARIQADERRPQGRLFAEWVGGGADAATE
jgi:hypothetical protein